MDLLDGQSKMNADTDKETQRSSREEISKSARAGRTINVTGDRIDSLDLFINTREVTIAHGGDIYRLRLTAQNKLILTK
jgi:hemin uptake protein HemP